METNKGKIEKRLSSVEARLKSLEVQVKDITRKVNCLIDIEESKGNICPFKSLK